MKNTVTNRQAVCDVLLKAAENDKDIIVLCSDSRGSASLKTFAEKYPRQFVEVGIAEQNLVSVAAGLASCGKKAIAASPACFLSTRSYEQVKIDVAYSETNVLLLGISGGISYGALGMTHHSVQDVAAMTALPGMRVYIPSDRFQTTLLFEELLKDKKPAYIRVSRSATEDVYDKNADFTLDQANVIKEGTDAMLVACGEMVPYAIEAARLLEQAGISTGVIDMYCLKPFDENTLLDMAEHVKLVVTAEEHSPFGGLGSLAAQTLSANAPKKLLSITLPDGHIIAGKNNEVFEYYAMDAKGIADRVIKALNEG